MELLPAVRAHIDVDPPALLYHYTNPQAFIGICTNRELWAGRASDMNDTTEQSLIFDFAAELLGESPPVDPDTREIAGAMLEAINMGRAAPRMQLGAAYTVSLTTEGDSLEQWRAYCPRSGGTALAIPTAHLRALAEANGFFLAPCIYDANLQRSFVKALVDDRLTHFRSQQHNHGGDPIDHLYEMADSFFDTLCQYAPLLKHSAFSREREWRLVSAVFPDSERKYIATSDGLKMYIPFAMDKSDRLGSMRPLLALFRAFEQSSGARLPAADDDNDWRLSQYGCVLGPNRDLAAMWGTVRKLMDKGFGRDTWIVQTQIPYR